MRILNPALLILLVSFISSDSLSLKDNKLMITSEQEAQELVKSNVRPFQEGEELKYLLHYGLLNAGIAELKVRKSNRWFANKKADYNMIGKGWTIGATDWFFKVDDHYETFMNEDDLSALRFIRRVNEGGFKINQDYYFFPDSNKVNTQDEREFHVPDGVQDMLSVFYYARSLDFHSAVKGDVYEIPTFVDNKLEYIKIKYKGIETVKIKNGKYQCLKFNPLVLEGRVFKDDEDLTVWVSNDENKVPILIQSKIIVGSIKAELIDYSQLKFPLAKVN